MCGISLSSLGSFTELWLNADPFPQHFSTSVPFSSRSSDDKSQKEKAQSIEEDASASSVGPPCCLLVLLKAALSDGPQQRTHFRNSMG